MKYEQLKKLESNPHYKLNDYQKHLLRQHRLAEDKRNIKLQTQDVKSSSITTGKITGESENDRRKQVRSD